MSMNRRNFLKAGAATLSIPFLESMMNKAQAQVVSGNLKRVLFFGLTNSQYEDHLMPTQTNYLIGPEGVRYIPLNTITGDISKIYTADKWGALKSKMNIMRGFDVLSAENHMMPGHETAIPLTACGEYSPSAIFQKNSIDTVIANSIQMYPTTPFKRILNAIPTNSQDFRYNYSWQNGDRRTCLGGPSKIFQEFFSGALPGAGMTPPDTNMQRRLSLQAAFNKMTGLSSSNRLSANDKMKLSAHADMINRLLPSLATPVNGGSGPGAGCAKPAAPAFNESFNSAAGNQARLRSCLDQIYMAFNCQLTNVATFNPVVAYDTGNWEMGDGGNDVYHQMAGHHYEPAKYLKYNGWVYDQLLYLLNMMNGTVESNGLTMLDNSLVVVVSNDACGVHSYEDMPVTTFGSLGGKIKTGNYINYQRPEAPQKTGGYFDLVPAPQNGQYYKTYKYNLGRPLGSLYTTILNALNIPHTGFGGYVDPKGLYADFTSAAGKQANLPIIT